MVAVTIRRQDGRPLRGVQVGDDSQVPGSPPAGAGRRAASRRGRRPLPPVPDAHPAGGHDAVLGLTVPWPRTTWVIPVTRDVDGLVARLHDAGRRRHVRGRRDT